jgi:hypothetical protein
MNDASEVLLSIFSCLHEALHLQNLPTPSTQGDGLLPTPSNWPAPRNKAGTAFKATDGQSRNPSKSGSFVFHAALAQLTHEATVKYDAFAR